MPRAILFVVFEPISTNPLWTIHQFFDSIGKKIDIFCFVLIFEFSQRILPLLNLLNDRCINSHSNKLQVQFGTTENP